MNERPYANSRRRKKTPMKVLSILFIGLFNFIGTVFAQDFDPKAIYQMSAKSVVLIVASDMGSDSYVVGTGSIIHSDGLILTNAHVVFNKEANKPYNEIFICLKPEHLSGNLSKDTSNRYNAVLVNYSSTLDLAVLKIRQTPAPASFPILQLGNSEKVTTGDPVVAIGHPEQGGLWTLTTGTIGNQIENFQNIRGKNVFQTETSLNRGNSGGPLIDRNGFVVGINSNISRMSDDGLAITGINFSIKSSVAIDWLKSVGYNYGFASSQKTSAITPEKKAIIDPAPIQNPIQTETQPRVADKSAIVTNPRPYKEEDLFKSSRGMIKQMENERENMMQNIRKKINK